MILWIRWLSCFLFLPVVMTAMADNFASERMASERMAPERVLWDKRPIQVHIQTHQERIIHFPDEIRYWLPDSLANKVTIVSANGVLYVTALELFSSTRIRVQGINNQQIYLLDITSNDSAQISDELIVMVAKDVVNRTKVHTTTIADDWRIRLTRYAAQQLYAPERLLVGDSAIKRIPLNSDVAVPLIRGGEIEAMPIASWRGGDFTVTAIRLRNRQQKRLLLRFDGETEAALNLGKLIRGRWLTATLQHNHLDGAGSEGDTTTLYLVSRRPFLESLGLDMKAEQPGQVSDG